MRPKAWFKCKSIIDADNGDRQNETGPKEGVESVVFPRAVMHLCEYLLNTKLIVELFSYKSYHLTWDWDLFISQFDRIEPIYAAN